MSPTVPPNQGQPTPANAKKLSDFNLDLIALCNKYQYDLRAVLQPQFNEYGVLMGHISLLKVFEKSPKDIEDTQTPPAPTDPATLPVPPAPTLPTPSPVPPTVPPVPPVVPPVDPTAGAATPVPGVPTDAKKNDPSPAVNADPSASVPTNPQTNPLDSTPSSPEGSLPGN